MELHIPSRPESRQALQNACNLLHHTHVDHIGLAQGIVYECSATWMSVNRLPRVMTPGYSCG